MRVSPLTSAIEGSFLKFLKRDIINNFFALLDLRFYRDETKFWIGLEGDEIRGYLLEHGGKDLNLRGDVSCVAELLSKASLAEPDIFIEPRHLPVLRTFYEPIRRFGPPTGEKIATLLVMGMDRKSFKPITKQKPRELGANELEAARELYRAFYEEAEMGPVRREDALEALKGHLVYGTYAGNKLASFSAGIALEDVAYVSNVYTVPKFREMGHATSTCSALVNALFGRSEKVLIMVLADNIVAQKVYERIGFTRTGHKFLAFRGRRKVPVNRP